MYLYVFRTRGSSKVGVSKDPWKRLAGLQTATFREVKMVETFLVDDEDRARGIEATALADLAKRFERRGEWFRAPPWACCKAVQAAIKTYDPETAPRPKRLRKPRQKATKGSGIGELDW